MIRAIIVEDDPMVAQINRHYLQSFQSIRVDGIFNNGRDALKYVKAHKVDLMIIDLAMPVMAGAELVREMRKARISSDIIVVTAANDVNHLSEMLKYGIIDYLVKPFDSDRFSQAIQKYLNKANILSVKETLKQEDIDALMSMHSTTARDTRKGIQQATLEKIISYIKKSGNQSYTCESLSEELSLSRVTIRRYLNYLVETNVMFNSIDYSTGGRPSIIYMPK
jgi:response regulator of citrate/malate metabolism